MIQNNFLMLPYLYTALIFYCAGFIQGVTGFGSALVAMPLLLLFLKVKTAVPLSILCGLVITAYLSVKLKQHMVWTKILPLCLGCIPGIFAGIYFLKSADDHLIRMCLGILIAAYSLYCLVSKPTTRKLHPVWSYIAGFATGAIGSAFSAGGPPTIIYLTLTDRNKDRIKATLTGFFFITGICIALAHGLTGLTTSSVLGYFSISGITVFAGVWTGSALYEKISHGSYLNIILIVLIILGIMLILSGF